MKAATLAALSLLFLGAQFAWGQSVLLPASFKTTKGLTISNAKITARTDSSIKVMHDGGIATLQHAHLPPEVLALLGITAAPPSEPGVKLPDPLETPKGTYKELELVGVEPDGIRIKHSLGSAKVRYEDLPQEVITLVGPFDPERAEAFRKAEDERNREAYTMARKAIEDAQTAGVKADLAARKALDDEKAALLADPNFISPRLYIEIRAQSTGGKNRDTDWATTWGSYNRTETSKREMHCTIQSKYRGFQRARLQCLFLTRDVTGSRDLKTEVVADAKVSLGPEAVKRVSATGEAQQSDDLYAAIGIRYREGEKYVGWCWRAIDGTGRITAVYSSTTAYDRYAWAAPVEAEAQ